jgi:hypothetical protein
MRRKSQFLFVTPQDIGTCADGRFGQNLMEIRDLVFAMISYQDEDGSLSFDDASFNERPYSFVQTLADHLTNYDDVYGKTVKKENLGNCFLSFGSLSHAERH